jgi:2-methylisocitrate lyase-like PEP mutase family enzyme
MAKACLRAYEQILAAGTSKHLLPHMQTRQELYTVLQYERYEQEMDDAVK